MNMKIPHWNYTIPCSNEIVFFCHRSDYIRTHLVALHSMATGMELAGLQEVVLRSLYVATAEVDEGKKLA